MYKSIGPYELSHLRKKLGSLLQAKKYSMDKNINRMKQLLPLQDAINLYINAITEYDFDDLLPFHFDMIEQLIFNSVISKEQGNFIRTFYINIASRDFNYHNYNHGIDMLNYLFNTIISNNFDIKVYRCDLSDVCDCPDSDMVLFLPGTVAHFEEMKADYYEEWKDDESYSEYLEDEGFFFSKVFSQDSTLYLLNNLIIDNHDLLFTLDELINNDYCDDSFSSVREENTNTIFTFSDDLVSSKIPIEFVLLTILGCYERTKGGICIKI